MSAAHSVPICLRCIMARPVLLSLPQHHHVAGSGERCVYEAHDAIEADDNARHAASVAEVAGALRRHAELIPLFEALAASSERNPFSRLLRDAVEAAKQPEVKP